MLDQGPGPRIVEGNIDPTRPAVRVRLGLGQTLLRELKL